jgi:hypothetical protein
MFIRSRDPAHPVLLFLHGGMPEYFLTERYPLGLENDFMVAWWEQRGIFWPSLRSPHYTAAEKLRLWRGKLLSGVSALWDEMLAADLAGQVQSSPFRPISSTAPTTAP